MDIENAIQGICGTSVAHLEPERKRESGRKKKNSIPGNSNWYEWSWPTEGEYAGFIQARAMPNIGIWKIFEPAKIAQFEKRPLEKPNPQVSDHSTPTSNWNIPLPHKSKINPNRLTIEELKKKLRDYGIDTDIMSDNRVVLAEILQNILNDETSKQVSDMLNTETIDTDLDSRQVSDYKLDFSLSSGWALKENQKFGKKGGAQHALALVNRT
ncbi:unnamed protein product [Rhizophagus irregularis]|nr:unnamed protein product [Rhizophagus irregularis]CAB4392578.1 unnamed protein product [Rhizophagus irregularis]CAB4401612.1 unnamed protein product [Rhizophagus irregularis]